MVMFVFPFPAIGNIRYTASEPLPWSEFIIQRAKVLIRTGQGETGVELKHDLQELIIQADQAGFIESKASLLTAQQQVQQSSETVNRDIQSGDK